MYIAEQTLQAEENHRDATRAFQKSMEDLHPANVAPALARQAVLRDTRHSYVTLQAWMRASDQDFTDLE